MRRRLRNAFAAVFTLAALASLAPAKAADGAVSFKGKTMRMVVGASAGGGFDTYARIIAAHLSRHLPGNPAIVVQNMAGAGSLSAANYLTNVAPKDGTVIGALNPLIVTNALVYPDRFKFDATRVKWIGSALKETHVAIAWRTSKIASFEDVFRRDFLVAGSGGTTNSYPVLVNAVLGTRFKVVSGYPGTSEGNLAMERGEVEGIGAITWASVKATQARALANHDLRVLVQFGLAKHPELANVPWIFDYARNDADRAALRLVLASQEFGRPYLVADGVPAAVVAALRNAFDETMKAADFRADAAKRGLDLEPTRGAEIQATVDDIYKTRPDVIARVAKILAADAR